MKEGGEPRGREPAIFQGGKGEGRMMISLGFGGKGVIELDNFSLGGFCP